MAARDTKTAIKQHLWAGLALLVVLCGGVGGWAATTEISGAVIAPGVLVVDSNVKKVQHPTGGVVGEIREHDGDRVVMGDIVVRLDETVPRGNHGIESSGLEGLISSKARVATDIVGLRRI